MCKTMAHAGPAIANKLFYRGTFPVFKAAGTSKHDLAQWIKLSLYFECPAIKRGRLFVDFVPRYPENMVTGVIVAGFGLHATLIAKYRRHMKHEYLVKAILGRQTYDHYSGSPVLAEYPYKQISVETIRSALSKFVGDIEQAYPTTLLQERKYGQLNSTDFDLQTEDRLQQTVGDCVQITHSADDKNSDGEDDELDEMNDNDHNNNNNLESYGTPAAAAVGRHPTLRIMQCHSIELLRVDDAVVQMRITADGLFSCRAFVRDLGLELGCHAVIDQLHLKSIGPFSEENALHKHELHVEQIEQSLVENAERSQKYYSQLREQYPVASSTFRFI